MLTENFDNYEDLLEMQFPMLKMILRDILKFNIIDEDIMNEISERNKNILIPKKCNT
jgi:hypothetical protein